MKGKTLIWLVKYFPLGANLGILSAILLSLINVQIGIITGSIVGCSLWPTLIILILSKDLHFCTWHRILLYNTILYALLHITQKLGLDFNYYLWTALVVNIGCLIVALILFKRDGCYTKTASKRSKEVNRRN